MIPMHSRYIKARATVEAQRRMLHRLHAENAAKDREIARLRTILRGHPDELRRMLAASPDAAKQAWAAMHDRCDELTRANAARKCADCNEDAGADPDTAKEAS